jgi:hypothetical protein
MQSIGAANGWEAIRKKRKRHFVRSQPAGGAQDSQKIDRNWIILVHTLHVAGS